MPGQLTMDFYNAIRELVEEKKRLDRLIAALEAVKNGDAQAPVNGVTSRRGRKAMSEDERREVSERMKRYWANRRSATSGETTSS